MRLGTSCPHFLIFRSTNSSLDWTRNPFRSPRPMSSRVRHCVECPKCRTRYLVGFSPYPNGSYLLPITRGLCDEWILYCSCARPPHSSRWNWNELKLYDVGNQAHHRGYGPPEEIVCLDRSWRHST